MWDRIFDAVSAAYDGDLQMVDSSSIRVHQHAANVKKGDFAQGAAAGNLAQARCMGRSRGGLTTKIHALVDAEGMPIVLKLSEGQAHDGRSAADMLDGIGNGQILLADRAYDSDALRQSLAARGAWANVKPLARRIDQAGVQPVPVPLPQSRRALLQQTQTLQSRRNPLRKARRQLSRPRQTRRIANLDAQL